MGDMVMESTRFGPDSACKAREGEDLSEQLANAIQFLQAEIKPYEMCIRDSACTATCV